MGLHARGIPLHGMLNHLPTVTGTNVGIFSYGNIKSFASPNDASYNGVNEPEDNNKGGTMPNDRSTIDNWDIFLFASNTIHLGDELFISCKGKVEGGNTEEKQCAWILLQYGFSIGKQ